MREAQFIADIYREAHKKEKEEAHNHVSSALTMIFYNAEQFFNIDEKLVLYRGFFLLLFCDIPMEDMKEVLDVDENNKGFFALSCVNDMMEDVWNEIYE